MSTIITAINKVELDPVTCDRIEKMITGSLFTTYTVYPNFKHLKVKNRPQTFLVNLIPHGKIDKVIQLGYNGTKSDIVIEAELFDIDVILVRSME